MKYNSRPLTDIDFDKYPHLKDVSVYYIVCIDGVDYSVMMSIVPVNEDYRKETHWKRLRIRRLDNEIIGNCSVLQEIKNDLIGSEQVAIEVYPAKGDYIDRSNTRHLWSHWNLDVPNLNELYDYK